MSRNPLYTVYIHKESFESERKKGKCFILIQIRLNSNHDFCAKVWRATASFEVTREECKEEKDKESLLERAQIGKMSVNPRL